MRTDYEQLNALSSSPALQLRFYEWAGNSATYGYFIDPAKHFCQSAMTKNAFKIARRPTGGGILFHTSDLAFSLIIPKSHAYWSLNPIESYQRINAQVLKAVVEVLQKNIALADCSLCSSQDAQGAFCMAKPTIYDVMLEGRKVGGAAERRTKHGLLHQGSLCLGLPERRLVSDVLRDEGVFRAMQEASYPLGENYRAELKAALIQHLTSQ